MLVKEKIGNRTRAKSYKGEIKMKKRKGIDAFLL
jgi:hypothetical protein